MIGKAQSGELSCTRTGFVTVCDIISEEEEREDDSVCQGCKKEIDECQCQQIMERFHNVNRKL